MFPVRLILMIIVMINHLVWISPFAVHLGVVTVTKTHRDPNPWFAQPGLPVSVSPLAWVMVIVNT